MFVGLPGGTTTYTDCLNHASWTSAKNECGNTPANPINSVIHVSGQSLRSSAGTETVTIDNAKGTWK